MIASFLSIRAMIVGNPATMIKIKIKRKRSMFRRNSLKRRNQFLLRNMKILPFKI
jgi:hypothetical protein